MLEGLTQNLSKALSVFSRSGRLTEANIREGMRQVRQALLEADVNYDVAQEFVQRVPHLTRPFTQLDLPERCRGKISARKQGVRTRI